MNMSMKPEDQIKLERLVDQVCREQSPLPAPPALRARVFAELQRRASLPWWHQSFASWPLAIRAVFMLAAVVAARATFSVTVWLTASFSTAQFITPFSRPLSWVQTIGALTSFLDSLCAYVGTSLLHRVPNIWLYGGALGVLAMYALLVGLGATAYRTLYATR